MFISPKYCPNEQCINHRFDVKDFYIRVGYYKSKKSSHPIPRFECKACGKRFSTSTFKDTYNDKLEIKKELFNLLVSGVSLRRCAILLKVNYQTVEKHFYDLGQICFRKHYEHLANLQTGYVQIDELETFIHTRAKPLSIPMVVRVKTGEILGFGIARIKTKGRLAEIGQQHYGWVIDDRKQVFDTMLMTIKHCFKESLLIKTDGAKVYPDWIANALPYPRWNVNLEQINSPKKLPMGALKPYDKLFAINNTFAKMRHDLNRLGRKTWSTTKTIQGLECHLWLYVAWVNGYVIL